MVSTGHANQTFFVVGASGLLGQAHSSDTERFRAHALRRATRSRAEFAPGAKRYDVPPRAPRRR